MGLDGDITIEVREARSLGSIDPKELKIVRRSVSFNLRSIRIPNEPGPVLGWWPDGESSVMVKLAPLTFEIKDEATGATLKRIEGCKPTSLRFSVEEGTLFQENCSWRGTKCTDGDT
jgi:hypothetical protein